jgi:hypothetical protein
VSGFDLFTDDAPKFHCNQFETKEINLEEKGLGITKGA